MKKSNILPTIVLCSICLVVALLLSFINMLTAPIIKEAQDAAANDALLVVLPEGKNFEKLEINESYPAVITSGYKADGGFVFEATVTGKSTGLVIMCGIDAEGKIVATKVIADQETDSYDAKVFPFVEGADGAYKSMTLDGFEPYLVSGATLTSRAYSEAVKASLQAFVIANGGSVDVRSPEQILQDSCNEALGTEGLEFTKWFATEVLEGIDSVYTTTENLYVDIQGENLIGIEEEVRIYGYVYVIGESFIGVDEQGEIVTENVSDDNAALVTAAHSLLTSSTETEMTKLDENIHSSIVKVSVTNTNNYIFEVKANGFSIYQYNEYSSGANAPIIVKVAISADGKIIDCRTLSHSESKGYGDACATEDYYDSWRGVGKDEVVISTSPITGDSTDPGAISGATYTSEGYQKAIKRAFEAFEILVGGENK